MMVDRLSNQTHTSQPARQPDLNLPNDIAISVRQLSKMYPLYKTPGDRLKQSLWYALPKFLRGQPKEFYREFWALHNISFEVNKGETIGIIGRNGSGKSTLLQILAGTLSPTHGEVQLNGRVAALLELGSGFNPEFTGRENVYLNGSIWGLTQAEIDDIFDDIAAFADIGQFIDQPVKFYSSGMFVRLAFAVQAFVPKEIFIVDEALAVGDEAFQRKCMAALERFRDKGGTVLLVSHDTQTIVHQCERCLLLFEGELLINGASKPVTDLYQKLIYSEPHTIASILTDLRQHGLKYTLTESSEKAKPAERKEAHMSQPTVEEKQIIEDGSRTQATDPVPTDWYDPNMPKTNEVSYGDGEAEIVDYGIYNEQGELVNVLVVGRRYRWVYRVKFYQDAYNVQFGMMLKTVDGINVAGIASKDEQIYLDHIPASSVIEASFSVKLNVAPGNYFLNAGVDSRSAATGELRYLHRRVDICMIRVLPPDAREIRGIAYLEPYFEYTFQPEIRARSGEVKAC